jgi:hypothetical protein
MFSPEGYNLPGTSGDWGLYYHEGEYVPTITVGGYLYNHRGHRLCKTDAPDTATQDFLETVLYWEPYLVISRDYELVLDIRTGSIVCTYNWEAPSYPVVMNPLTREYYFLVNGVKYYDFEDILQDS